ncbi:MAG: hypothetical protein HY826_09235 [Actinobacteria bacterium]|nr:hypothetical protein [Actinomycetota bacterium]
MTIRKGVPWGQTVPSPTDLLVVPTDRDAREFVVGQRLRQAEHRGALRPLGLGGGDLARTMGGGHDRFPGMVTEAPIDLLRVQSGERVTWAVAHVIARRRWWSGEVLFAMNAQFLSQHGRCYDVAPRSHPNDGKVDIVHVSADMRRRARHAAARRARTGTHLPHPQLMASQVSELAVTFERPLVLWVDGRRWGTARDLSIAVEPDALIVYA